MELKIQIVSLLYSFIYGYLFFFVICLFDKIKNNSLKYIFSIFIVVLFAILYFIGLLYINNGYLHIYFLFIMVIGYLFNSFLMNRYFTYIKKSKM